MLHPKYLCVILAKMVVPAVVPPTRIIRPIPHPINIPPKMAFTSISSEAIVHPSVK